MGDFYDSIRDEIDQLDENFVPGAASFGVDYDGDSSTVKQVQTAINAAGYTPALTVDGVYGPNTAAGVAWLQAQKGLGSSQLIDDSLLKALGIAIPVAAAVVASTGSQQVLPNKSTPLTASQAADAFNAAYKEVTGEFPSVAVLGLLLAQSAVETGNWGPGIHNYNFGNAKATASFPTVQYFRCSEVVNGVLTYFDPPSPVCRFQAFKTAKDGAVAYIKLLKGRSNWWNGLHTGTTSGFVAGLTSPPAYFTASPSAYEAGLNARLVSLGAVAAQYAGKATKLGVKAIFASIALWLVGGVVTIAGVTGYRALKQKQSNS
jgi:peptidoglycan hydrolase-like protein with peptidoglycan-binding domain